MVVPSVMWDDERESDDDSEAEEESLGDLEEDMGSEIDPDGDERGNPRSPAAPSALGIASEAELSVKSYTSCLRSTPMR